MSFKPLDEGRWLHDMLERICQFIAGLSYEEFVADTRTVYAVTRCLEIISEASRRLSEALKARHPHILWKDMAGAGNIYRHDYEDVGALAVWHTVENSLPALRTAIEAELKSLRE